MALKHISYSYLHLLSCPYQAFLRYKAAIKAPTSPWIALGNAVHFAIENAHKDSQFDLNKAISLFKLEFARILEEDEVFISWPQTIKGNAEGCEMLEGYYGQIESGAIPKEPLELEKEFRIPFGGIEIVGRIDKIDKSPNGGLIVTDFKTGKAKPDEWFLRHDLQLTAYAWACLTLYQQLPEALVWHHLRTGERLASVRTMQDINELEMLIKNAIEMDKKGYRHRIFNASVCGMCDYSGLPKAGGVRAAKPICDDHELEQRTVERLGLK